MINIVRNSRDYMVQYKSGEPLRFSISKDIIVYGNISEAKEDALIVGGYVIRCRDINDEKIIKELTNQFEEYGKVH